MMDVFQQEPELVDGCAVAILKAILKVLYHHSVIRHYACRTSGIAQLQQLVFRVFQVVGLLLPHPLRH